MADIIEEVRQKRKKIEELQQRKAKQDGQREQLYKQLKTESGVDSINAADEELEKLGQELIENEKFLEELDSEMGQIIHDALPGSSAGSDS